MEKAVEKLLDIKIDHYVLIDFEGFRQVISLLGGVDVEVPQDLGVNDPFYSETERLGDFYPCVFQGGKTYRMDPSQALCYARVRNGSDDRERILRQQTVIDAVVKKAAQLNILSSPTTMFELWKRYKERSRPTSTTCRCRASPGWPRQSTKTRSPTSRSAA